MRTIPDPQNPAVVKWLGGIQQAWTILDWDSFLALHFPHPPTTGRSGWPKSGWPAVAGMGAPVAATKARYSALVTG